MSSPLDATSVATNTGAAPKEQEKQILLFFKSDTWKYPYKII